MDIDILAEAREVLGIEQAAISRLAQRLDEKFVRAVTLLIGCRGKVVLSGLGKSGLVARKIAATLASTGTPAIFLHSAEGPHGDLGLLVRGDVAVLVSNSGETEETLRLIPSLKRIGIPLLALTGAPQSSLAQHADVWLDVGVEREACPYNLTPTASTTALLSMGDALAIVLMKLRGLKKEDFAFLHPGGSLGKRLFLKVDDLMHANEKNATVSVGASLKAAILEMTAKALGAVCVVGPEGQLIGLLTDGDLRRALERFSSGLLELPVSEVMTRRPVTIALGTLAVEALRQMEDRPSQISVLPVVDALGRAAGLLRIHDLVKAGVA